MLAQRALAACVACAALSACAEFASEMKQAGRTLSDPKSWRLGGGSAPADAAASSVERGAARGESSAEEAVNHFIKAIRGADRKLLLEVTCHGKTRASCKHHEADQREADEWMQTAREMKWERSLGGWVVRPSQESAFAYDTWPGSSRVSVVSVCRIVEPEDKPDASDADLRWGICNVQEMARVEASRLAKSTN